MSWEEVMIGQARLICAKAEEVLPTLPDASVNLICVDPPYFKVKLDYAGEKLTWDRQWPTRTAYLAWLRGLALEWRRILTPNGSLYVFASPQMAAHVEVMLGEVFQVLNHIVWVKHDGSGAGTGGHSKVCKEDLMSYFPQSERIIFCGQHGADSMALGLSGYAAQCAQLHSFVFEPIRAYLAEEFRALGWTNDDLNRICGTASMAGRHYTAKSQWCLPTAEHYAKLQQAATEREYGHLRREYEDLRREYEDLRREYEDLRREYEDLRRPFTVSPTTSYTDVWSFETVKAEPGKHPCQKPVSLYRHIVMASSRERDLCLDSCAGSFAFLDAVRQCGRIGIGIEQDRRWWQRGCQRLSQVDLFEEPPRPVKTAPPQQLTLA